MTWKNCCFTPIFLPPSFSIKMHLNLRNIWDTIRLVSCAGFGSKLINERMKPSDYQIIRTYLSIYICIDILWIFSIHPEVFSHQISGQLISSFLHPGVFSPNNWSAHQLIPAICKLFSYSPGKLSNGRGKNPTVMVEAKKRGRNRGKPKTQSVYSLYQILIKGVCIYSIWVFHQA